MDTCANPAHDPAHNPFSRYGQLKAEGACTHAHDDPTRFETQVQLDERLPVHGEQRVRVDVREAIPSILGMRAKEKADPVGWLLGMRAKEKADLKRANNLERRAKAAAARKKIKNVDGRVPNTQQGLPVANVTTIL